jgi:hypothetical protein
MVYESTIGMRCFVNLFVGTIILSSFDKNKMTIVGTTTIGLNIAANCLRNAAFTQKHALIAPAVILGGEIAAIAITLAVWNNIKAPFLADAANTQPQSAVGIV